MEHLSFHVAQSDRCYTEVLGCVFQSDKEGVTESPEARLPKLSRKATVSRGGFCFCASSRLDHSGASTSGGSINRRAIDSGSLTASNAVLIS